MKFKSSEIKKLINEEIQRVNKIEKLTEQRDSIKSEIDSLLNEFTIVSPGDKKSLKALTKNGKEYLESLTTLLKKYPESKFQKILVKFATIHKEAESELSQIAFKGEAKPENPGQLVDPAMPKAVVQQVTTPVAATVGYPQPVAEGEGLSLANKKGMNVKPVVLKKK